VTKSRSVLKVQLMIMRIHDRNLQEAMDADELDIDGLAESIKAAENDDAIQSRGRSKTLKAAKSLLEEQEKERRKALGIKRATHFDDKEYAAATLRKLRSKLKAAAYDNGKLNWEKLYADFDRDNDGTLSYQEFYGVIRRVGKIDKAHLSDEDLVFLWGHINTDHDDSINFHSEFLPWLLEGEAP